MASCTAAWIHKRIVAMLASWWYIKGSVKNFLPPWLFHEILQADIAVFLFKPLIALPVMTCYVYQQINDFIVALYTE